MFEAEVLQGLAILLLEVSSELCTKEHLLEFFETLFVNTPAAKPKEIYISDNSNVSGKSNLNKSSDNNEKENDGDEVAAVLFDSAETTRCVLEKLEVVSSGSAYNLELRRGYLELNKERVLVEGVLSASANTSTSSPSSVDTSSPAVTTQMEAQQTTAVHEGMSDSSKGIIDTRNTIQESVPIDPTEQTSSTSLPSSSTAAAAAAAVVQMSHNKLEEPHPHHNSYDKYNYYHCSNNNYNNNNNNNNSSSKDNNIDSSNVNIGVVNQNEHVVLYFTFISIHVNEGFITPFIIYQILCGVCVPEKILVLKKTPHTNNTFHNNNNKEQRDRQLQHQRQHLKALVEVRTLDEANDVIKYFDNIRVELMSSSPLSDNSQQQEQQQYNNNNNNINNNVYEGEATTSNVMNVTNYTTIQNVEMRFIVRVRLSSQWNEEMALHRTHHANNMLGLQLRGNTPYSLELTRENVHLMGSVFDRQYEYRVEDHNTAFAPSTAHVNKDQNINDIKNNNNICNKNIEADVYDHSTHTSHTNKQHATQQETRSSSYNKSNQRSRSRSRSNESLSSSSSSSSSFESSWSSSHSSSPPSSIYSSSRERSHTPSSAYSRSTSTHLKHRHQHNNSLPHSRHLQHRKREHTPSLSVMKYKRTRQRSNNSNSSNNNNNSSYNDNSNNVSHFKKGKIKNDKTIETSSPLSIAELTGSNVNNNSYSKSGHYVKSIYTSPLSLSSIQQEQQQVAPEGHFIGANTLHTTQSFNSTVTNYENSVNINTNDNNKTLPVNWREVFSSEYQQVYYVYRDPVSGVETTTWTHPSLSSN